MKNISDQDMSNLTTASNEAISVSSTNRDDGGGGGGGGGLFSPHYNFPVHHLNQTHQPAVKKKRNQPGHPDPEAEVISLSPRSLLATNRFVCDVCNKGFQRDQNLQLHRRGHNLPWKLKQRSTKDPIRKKVYVCPETSCVHHEPSRALGDLTGVKKHFCRKHGEKKWKCEKCTKKYAVQSDWKAHSKICGTREYRCDCGTLFSRRDSFITHRAFCDALAQENAIRSITAKNISDIPPNHHHHLQQIESQFIVNTNHDDQYHQIPVYHPIKKELLQGFTMSLKPSDFPPWSSPPGPPAPSPLDHPTPPSLSPSNIFQYFHQNPNPNMGPSTLLPPPPHISATSLLQKSAEMGAKGSSGADPAPTFIRPHHALASRDGLASNDGTSTAGHNHYNHPSSLFYDMMMMGDPGTSFDHDDRGLEAHDQESLDFHAALDEFSRSRNDNDDHGSVEGGTAGTTRDFLGLRALSQSEFMSIAGLSNCMGSSSSNGNACNNNL